MLSPVPVDLAIFLSFYEHRSQVFPKYTTQAFRKIKTVFFFGSYFLFCRVAVPFQSDRVNLNANPKWKKNAGNNNQRIVWADSVLKINRKNGKVY